jgi:WD40 repeat protein
MKNLWQFKNKYERLLAVTFAVLALAVLTLGFLNTQLRAHVRSVDIVGSQNQAAIAGQKITLHFNQPMDKNSVIAALQVNPATTKFDVGWGVNTLLISFRGSLESNTKYTLTIGDSAQDIYGTKLAGQFKYEFMTKVPSFIYAERNYLATQHADNIIRSSINGDKETLFSADDIDLFAANGKYLAVSINNPAGDSSLKLVNLSTKKVTDITLSNRRISKLVFSPTQDQFIYVAQEVSISDGVAIPTTPNMIYLYGIDTQETKNLDPQNTAQDVADLVFAPDGNSVLFRGDDGTYYLFDINNPDNLVMIGKHFATGGFNPNSDRIAFVDYDPLGTGADYPYINVLNTNRENISVTKGENFVVDPQFFHNSNQMVISEKYQDLEGTKGMFKVVVLGDDGKPLLDFNQDNYSLELPKVSTDDRYVLVERYGQEELTNYQNMRSFVFQTKPYSATLVLYDLQQKKFLDQTWNGVDAVWEK